VSATDNQVLTEALTAAGLQVHVAGDALKVEAPPVQIGQIAADKQIVLTELRSADGGLENLFLELTSDTQRDDIPTEQGATP
jgi:ABC-2 type transport system ATP-binding protein